MRAMLYNSLPPTIQKSSSIHKLVVALPTTTRSPAATLSFLLTQQPKEHTNSNAMSPDIKENTYRWNSKLRGLLEGNSPGRAVLEYAHMRRRGVRVDSHTLLFVIKACSLLIHGTSEGEQIHANVLKMGFGSEMITQTALLRMYGMLGDLVSAQRTFDETPQRDLVQWNVLVGTYSQSGYPRKAIIVARDMILEGVRPNEVTLASIVAACSQLKALAQGKLVHGYAIKNFMGFDTVIYNALIDVYAKCACLSNARLLFGRMRGKNVISWTSMINGYCDNSCPHEALTLFKEMEMEDIRPDEVTVLGLVCMCAKLRSSELGNWIDDYVEQNGFGGSTPVANALIDMHSKCGNIKRACQIFDRMTARTLVSWSAIIQGLSMHGHGVAALTRFTQMQREGFKPDEIVFLNAISACSHAGLVEEGRQCFRSMVEKHGMEPWMEHYGSVIDLLCRAGLVKEAFEFMVSMPVKPDVVIWRMLIGACSDQGNIELAKQVMSRLLELDPEHSGNYIIKSNLHAMIGEWSSVEQVRNDMGIRGIIKMDAAYSSIEVK